MTKMVTTVAALRLTEQGTLDLDAPVARYRPEFGKLMVLERIEDGTPKLRPPASEATVRQLATHTTGPARSRRASGGERGVGIQPGCGGTER